MDIFFADPDDIPLPPEEVKIRQLEARPYPEGQRVAVRFEITPMVGATFSSVTVIPKVSLLVFWPSLTVTVIVVDPL